MDVPIEMKTLYFQRRLKDHSDCLAALENKDIKNLERIGHQMKGNAVCFGFDELGDIGEQLENASIKKDWDEIAQSVEKFGNYLSKNSVN